MGFCDMIPVGKICNATSKLSVIRPIIMIFSQKCCSQTANFAYIWDVKQSSLGMARNS